MTTINKVSVHLLGELLRDYGIRHIVVSSGSRCAPLSVAFARMGCFRLHPVIDERSAGFIALGISLTIGEPVAMLCTSGSAAMNYGPALAEAYYRRVPLVAITADRPARHVGQREGQTIRQAGALDAVVAQSIDIPECDSSRPMVAHINRLINQTLSVCTGVIPQPVHINIQFETPLTPLGDSSSTPASRKIEVVQRTDIPCRDLSGFNLPDDAKILLYVGGVSLNDKDTRALSDLRNKANVAMLADVQTNIPGAIVPMHCERILDEAEKPDLVAVVGGDCISTRFKLWLRKLKGIPFVSGCYENEIVDAFGNLDTHFDCSIPTFTRILETTGRKLDYEERWRVLADSGLRLCNTKSPAVGMVQSLFDHFKGKLVHVSNGTCARIVQLVSHSDMVRIEINRGVSGIDGSTSTAIGAAMAHSEPVLLITGDMSAAYDIGALGTVNMPRNFKMAVLDNSGGDIFRNISTTANLPELEELFAMKPTLPLRGLAEAYGFGFYRCDSTCLDAIGAFFKHDGPAILQMKVLPEESSGLI